MKNKNKELQNLIGYTERDPAIMFYTNDFLRDTMDLTYEEKGQYIDFLCRQHLYGHLSEKVIHLHFHDGLSDAVVQKLDIDENGCLYSKELDYRIAQRKNFVTTRQENGKKGGAPKGNTNAQKTSKKQPNGYPLGEPKNNLLENEDEDENENKSDTGNETTNRDGSIINIVGKHNNKDITYNKYKHMLFYEDKEAYVDVSKQKLVEQGDMVAIMSAFKDAGCTIL